MKEITLLNANFVGYLLFAWHCAKSFACTVILTLKKNLKVSIAIVPMLQKRKTFEKLSYLPKIMKFVNDRGNIASKAVLILFSPIKKKGKDLFLLKAVRCSWELEPGRSAYLVTRTEFSTSSWTQSV